MPIEAPKLDTRTYAEIVAEARRRIPRYTPEWTDYNESDPGMTLVELFAWLSEMMLFQMNRVPERNYVKFLNLLDLKPRPAEPATAFLTFSPDSTEDVPAKIERGTGVLSQVTTADGTPVIFETEEELEMVTAPLLAVQVFDAGRFTVMTEANQTRGGLYHPFGRFAQAGNALYLGFAAPEPETGQGGVVLSNPFPGRMKLRVILPETVDLPPVTPQWTLVWEAARATGWSPLKTLEDGSEAFTRTGTVLLAGPREVTPRQVGEVPEALFYLRCVVRSGAPPVAADGEVRSPLLDTAAPNTVRAVSLRTVRDELLGTSNGLTTQVYRLEQTPVHVGSLRLVTEEQVEEDGGKPKTLSQTWRPIEDLFAAGPTERVYELDPASGLVRFGDGVHGLIPPEGAEILAEVYRYGGGAASNVGAGLVDTPLESLGPVAVTNWRPAVGGRDAESVEEVKRRAPLVLRNRDRAVTAEDYAALATEIGGVAQARALPLYNPDYPGVEIPGAVTVVILPATPAVPPQPSQDLLDEVRARLEPRRMITTELVVAGPRFRYLRVDLVVLTDPAADPRAVEDGVGEALGNLLSPEVQRVGQSLFPGQVYRAVLGVEGVREVLRLKLWVDDEPHGSTEKPVLVPRDGFLTLARLGVEVREVAGLSGSGDVLGWGGAA